MAYAYVGPGGAADGNSVTFVSEQTGTLAALGTSNYYSNIVNAINDASLGAGDFVGAADTLNHSHSDNANKEIGGPPVTISDSEPLTIRSVDADAIDVYSAGAHEYLDEGQGRELTLRGHLRLEGVELGSDSHFNINYCNLSAVDSILKSSAGVRDWKFERSVMFLENCEIGYYYPQFWNTIKMIYGHIHMVGGVIDCVDSVSAQNDLFYMDRYAEAIFEGVKIIGNYNNFAFFNDNQNVADQTLVLHDCEIETEPTNWVSGLTLARYGSKLSLSNCSHLAANAGYRYGYFTPGGSAEEDTDFYLTASVDGQNLSLRVDTSSATKTHVPFVFNIPVFAELSQAASDTITLELLSASTLDDEMIHANLPYRKNSAKNEVALVTTRPNPGATPVTLTASTAEWNDFAGKNRYKIELDSSTVVTGADGVCHVTLVVTQPNLTFWLEPSPTLS